jgi:hypothetical protein
LRRFILYGLSPLHELIQYEGADARSYPLKTACSGFTPVGVFCWLSIGEYFMDSEDTIMLKEMKAYGHLKPGQKGTHRLVDRFGPALICVRYRHDERTGDNLTTAEIIVDRRPRGAPRYRDTDMVDVTVPYTEMSLRKRLKAAGGRWNPEEHVWQVSFGAIRGDVELVERIARD